MNIQCIRIIVVACCIGYSVAAYAITFVPPIEEPDYGYCFIQNYVDVSSVHGGQDYYDHCRSYERHKGTDFRVSYAAMKEGVDVLAAADGKVLRTRDGMGDAYVQDGRYNVHGRECGNGVVIDHGGGWQTQYCHLKKGTVRVASGDEVKAGSVLGEIGLSGKTGFVHVHFQVTYDGKIVCPFSGKRLGRITKGVIGELQGAEVKSSLWQNDSCEILQYVPSQLLKVDYSTELPQSAREILQRSEAADTVQAGGVPLVFSAVTAMLQKGDVLILSLKTRSGRLVAEKTIHITSYTAQRFDYIGRKDSAMFAHTALEGSVELRRGNAQVFVHKSRVAVQ
ncbi:M23 family metallopeptidase [Halodesulfovibrio marinisediminis]|uniref:Peptidase family M23 n=1 Tax=Halodesulfovibrio marinisediminis DSM 17456 TaxID=1121457 RepID=A0A1N6GUI7_9BACT|nr:M23 family metallopeptidase [Halodesulfovibrio marinisediminis]SIO11240.1 Peptidase family M23 [Halodesulfovibrio marinisediminis DSM 17456]